MTVNVTETIAFDAFKDIYLQAWRLGCKGCTTYLPNDVTGSVLATTPAAQPEAAPAETPHRGFGDVYEAGGVVWMTKPLDRPEALPGRTYKIRWPDSDHAIYITLNDIVRDCRRAPFEVFINSKNMEHYAGTVALTRMISAMFRRCGDVSFVAEEMKAVFDPRGGQWLEGRYVPSLLAAIGEVIERHMIDIGFLPAREAGAVGRAAHAAAAAGGSGTGGAKPAPLTVAAAGLRQCPRCAAAGLVRQENCDVCLDCRHSKCACAIAAAGRPRLIYCRP